VRVAVFGLGYVGSVSAACLADRGHDVVGTDLNPLKVELIRSGKSPVSEPGLAEVVARARSAGHLDATADAEAAVAASDVSLICVGTPSAQNGSVATDALDRVVRTIGSALAGTSTRHTVVIRSTTLPGTARTLIPVLEETSGRRAGDDFGVATNPEFLREGTSVADFNDPPKTVIGELDEASGETVARLYEGLDAPLFRVPLDVGEMVKYVDNAFHALKIGFANEVGALCRAFGLDAHEVMRIFRRDTKLNISPAYLSPGFAFGGSCLPKDLRALLHAARHVDVELPLLEQVLPSNARHLERTIDLVTGLGKRRVGLFGLAFKPGTDDLRESPLVELAERLLGKGFQLKIFDPDVSLAQLVGANREYIEKHIPHLSVLLAANADEVVEHAEVCIVGASHPDTISALARADGRYVIDLVRLPDAQARRGRPDYVGVAW
jgi:GDP-mannose 6-dehydrogenase